MTVCIAAICRFNYGSIEVPDWGSAVITASDRMLTDEGIGVEYEPFRGKYAYVGKRALVLCADSLVVHSEILGVVTAEAATNPDITPMEVAEHYSTQINAIRARNAEKKFLSPFRLTIDEFNNAQATLNPTVATELADKILNYEVPVQALIVGCDKDNSFIFSVDDRGIVRNHSDIGFACIGIGAFHANTYFMEHSFWNGWDLWHAYMAIYAAKKRAEVSPGVGKNTDMNFVGRNGSQQIPQATQKALRDSFNRLAAQIKRLEEKATKRAYDVIVGVETTAASAQPPTQSANTATSDKSQT